MNRRERLNDPTVALQDAIRGAMASAWTALPGIVQ